MSQVTLTNGSGIAVYEVMDANPSIQESAQFPTFLALAPSGSGTTTITSENVSLGPDFDGLDRYCEGSDSALPADPATRGLQYRRRLQRRAISRAVGGGILAELLGAGRRRSPRPIRASAEFSRRLVAMDRVGHLRERQRLADDLADPKGENERDYSRRRDSGNSCAGNLPGHADDGRGADGRNARMSRLRS